MRVHNLDAQEAKRVSEGLKIDGDIKTNNIDMTCYFCEEVLVSWDERAKHIWDHIRKEFRTKAEWDVLKAMMAADRTFDI